jgi:hypothetical protein
MSEARDKANDTSLPVEERMKALEEDPPKDLKDWPSDRDMRNATFGGGEGEHGYEEGPEKKLGPSGLVHHEDGTTTVNGEEVDRDDYTRDEKIKPAVQNLNDEKAAESDSDD